MHDAFLFLPPQTKIINKNKNRYSSRSKTKGAEDGVGYLHAQIRIESKGTHATTSKAVTAASLVSRAPSDAAALLGLANGTEGEEIS